MNKLTVIEETNFIESFDKIGDTHKFIRDINNKTK